MPNILRIGDYRVIYQMEHDAIIIDAVLPSVLYRWHLVKPRRIFVHLQGGFSTA